MTADEMEKPAKRWEVSAITKDLANISEKLDKMDSKIITRQDLDDKLHAMSDRFQGEISSIHAKYGPLLKTYKMTKSFLWMVVLAILSFIGNIIMLILQARIMGK